MVIFFLVVPLDVLPTDLSLIIRKQCDNFDNGVGPSCFEEVKANEVIQSTQDCQGSDKDHQSNSFLQTESMTRHSRDLEAKEVHQEQKMRHISPINRGESVKGRVEETVKRDLTLDKLLLRVSPLEIFKQIPKIELVLIHQQHTLEESSGSKQLQPLGRNSRLSLFSGSPPDSYQSFGSLAEASGSHDMLRYHHCPATSYLGCIFSCHRRPCLIYRMDFPVTLGHHTTRVSNLSEALCAELTSSLSILGNVGFDASWIAAVQTRIHDCQVSLSNLHQTKKLRATKDAITRRLTELDAMRIELAEIDALLAEYAQGEQMACNVIVLP
ncbi:hypothetical protein L6164_003156 [Bauhinia variegata]|uniref:Uncharacterized protein n=1 Tax=Bauhinia variegata TaxID=167791 RepID=A0ACB9PZZ3_BAUVA|nr:hypothetical protein L6164_003156 [Bauhinia variegata]